MTDAEPTDEHGEQRIRTLDESTIQRIAAGEVVERPASVVKELIENSLDAGASRIEVAVQKGGTGGIHVSDDGQGISEADLPRAVAEHATSKISDIDDLESGVGSLGFRGEALSTIGAVSRLTVRSRPQGGSVGAELTVEGGTVGESQPAGCPEGTTVEVDDLFFNTPARKKFLKRESTEFDHINTVVSQYALANPDIAVSLSHNGRALFGTDGSGSLRSAVLSVYGREVAESMIEIDDEPTAAGPVGSVRGLISHPETTRSTRAYLATFVNDRYVTDATLRGAVVDGYGGQLAPDRYPFAVLFVEVPPAAVDVNVHPRKTEVRFDDSDGVTGVISEAVERTLVESGLIRSAAPRGRSAPEETQISPERTEQAVDSRRDRSRSPDSPAGMTDKEPNSDDTHTETIDTTDEVDMADEVDTTDEADTTDEVDITDKIDTGDGATAAETVTAEPVDPADEASWTVDGLGGTDRPTPPSPSADHASSGLSSNTDDGVSPAPTPKAGSVDTEPAANRSTDGVERNDRDDGHGEPVDPTGEWTETTTPSDRQAGPTTQRTLTGGETTDRRRYDTLPSLRVLGQLYDTYLLAETDAGLVLIDQHAADERVNYERLQRTVAESPTTQRLAEPVRLELTAREAALFDDHSEQLGEIGFQATRQETRSIEVTAVPAVFSTTLDPELLRDALLRFVESTDGGETTVTEAVDELLADLACYPSITGNTSLTEGSVVDLLAALDDCENPYACPHGRPVIIEISREEITDRFERDYPGHAGRRDE